jgi:hypothetical protein
VCWTLLSDKLDTFCNIAQCLVQCMATNNGVKYGQQFSAGQNVQALHALGRLSLLSIIIYFEQLMGYIVQTDLHGSLYI